VAERAEKKRRKTSANERTKRAQASEAPQEKEELTCPKLRTKNAPNIHFFNVGFLNGKKIYGSGAQVRTGAESNERFECNFGTRNVWHR